MGLGIDRGSVSSFFVETVDPALWLLLIVLGVHRLAASARSMPRRSLVALAATAGLSVVLAASLCPSRVGDVLNHVYYHGNELQGQITRYGCGVEALLVLVSSVFLPTDDVLAGLNLCAGATSVVLVYALARRVGYGRFVAHTAALMLAVAPLAIRFIPTHERYPLYICTMLAGFCMLYSFFDEHRPSDLAAAVLAVALSAQCRPEALAAVGLACALGVLEASRPPPLALAERKRQRLALFIALGGLVLLLAWPEAMMLSDVRTVGGIFLMQRYLGRLLVFFPPHNVFINPAYTPFVWSALGVVGLAVVGEADRRRRSWLLLAALVLTLALGDHPVTNYQRANARYYVPSLPFYFILAASGLATAIERLRPRLLPRVGPAAAVCMGALAFFNVPGVLRDTTADQEYRFLSRELARLPVGCTIVTAVWSSEDRGLQTPSGMAAPIAREQSWRRAEATGAMSREALVGDDGCAALYLPANCYVGPPGNDDPLSPESGCLRMRAEAGEAIAEADVTNAPFRAERYRGDSLHVGLYWLTRPDERAPRAGTTRTR
jgi:hypothetical protein